MIESQEIHFNKSPILLLEDSRHEVVLFRHTLKEFTVENELIIAENGEEGIEYLKKGNDLPAFILLDINMPKMNGFEFLEIIKADPIFKCIPVIVLTSSNRREDRSKAFSMGVSGYMTKPLDLNQYRIIVKTILDYWRLSESYFLPKTDNE